MGTIRRLTPDDLDAMVAVVETQTTLQGQPAIDLFLDWVKDTWVKRVSDKNVVFFGYFDDENELLCLVEYHLMDKPNKWAQGMAYTKKGRCPERWNGTSKWPKLVMDVTHECLEYLWQNGMTEIWVIGPYPPMAIGRMVEAEGSYLADRSRFDREDVGVISAGFRSGDYAVDIAFLLKGPLPTDQLVMKFVVKNPRNKPFPFRPKPSGMPPAPPPGSQPMNQVHPDGVPLPPRRVNPPPYIPPKWTTDETGIG